MRDIAKTLGLSHSTVSLALRGHPRISLGVREQIERTARKLGYRPEPMLAALAHYRKSKSTKLRSSIAWLNPWAAPQQLHNFRDLDAYWRGASAAANQFGYELDGFTLSDEAATERVDRTLKKLNIQGILIPPYRGVKSHWQEGSFDDYCVVRLGRSAAFPQSYVVTTNQVQNTLLAMRKIRERGYRRIGFVTGTARTTDILFEAGYLFANSLAEESPTIPVLRLYDSDPEKGPAQLRNWMREHQPDAIHTDMAGVHGLLRQIGYRVPHDVGLTVTSVLDGNADAGIDQNPLEVGRVAFLVLMSLLQDNARGLPPTPREILIAGKWVDGSTLPPRG